MTRTAAQPADLGPNTERLIADAFADAVLITAQVMCRITGLDPRTLRAMTDEGLIRAVRRGKLRAYTEADLRAYLTEGPDACRSTSRRTAPTSISTSSLKVVAFTDRQGSKPSGLRRK